MKFFQIVAEILLNAEKTELFVAMFVNYVIIVLEINVFAHLQIFEDWLKWCWKFVIWVLTILIPYAMSWTMERLTKEHFQV